MNSTLRFRFIVLLLCVCLAAVPISAQTGGIGPSGTEVYGAIVGIGAGLVVTGFVAYYLVHKGRSITGCVISNQSGLELQNGSDQKTYILAGQTANIKSGDRIRLNGKKRKDSSDHQTFLVEKLAKNYGPCKSMPVTP